MMLYCRNDQLTTEMVEIMGFGANPIKLLMSLKSIISLKFVVGALLQLKLPRLLT